LLLQGCLLLLLAICPIFSLSNLLCPPTTTSFSARESPRHYYSCREGEKFASLVECPLGHVYDTKEQICMKTQGEPEQMEVEVLGRPAQLGSLYDARVSMFFPEASFWSKETVNNHTEIQETHSTTWEVGTDQTIKDKHQFMDIKADLSLSFMDGLVKVSGAAAYMSDKVEATSEVNVALKYHSQTHFSFINVHTAPDFGEECLSDQFTHLVTSVTYGNDVYFVFKRQTLDSEDQTNVMGELDIAINAIPGFAINGGGKVNLTEKQQELLDTTHIRMHGDFSPEVKLPATFDQAVEFYRDVVPHQVPENYVGTTPLKVQLTPFKKDACSKEGQILNDLNSNLIADLRTMLDELERSDMAIGSLLLSNPAKAFKPLRENLQFLRTKLRAYTLQQKQAMQEILPKVKAGQGAEEELAELLSNYTASQFYFGTLELFIQARKREVKAIDNLVNSFDVESNIDMTDYETANDVEYIFQREMVIVMDLNILSNKSLILDYLAGNPVDESHFWFNNILTISTVGHVVRGLHKFGTANLEVPPTNIDRGYLLKITSYSNDPYLITAMLNGALISNHFEFPSAPRTPLISSLSHDYYSFNVTRQAFSTGSRVQVRDVTDSWNLVKDIPHPEGSQPGDEIEVRVDGMTAGHVYNITVNFITDVGQSLPSEGSKVFNTAPTSEPRGVSHGRVTASSLGVTWLPPAITAEDVPLDKIEYVVTLTGGEKPLTNTTTDLEVVFEGLADATEYSVSIVARFDLKLNIQDEVTDSQPATMKALTSPLPPTIIADDSQVSLHSALVKWIPPSRLGSPVLHYVLTWNSESSDSVTSEMIVYGTETLVTDLGMGESYTFNVKVVTEEGESEFSSDLKLDTPYEQTPMGKLRDEIFGAISHTVDVIKQEVRYCAIKEDTNTEGILTYDSNLFTSINTVDPNQWLDPSKGLFTAGKAGVYRVKLSARMLWELGTKHSVGVYVNDKLFGDALKTSDDADSLSEYGSWDSLIELNKNDILSIKHHTTSSKGLSNVSLCVSSQHFQ